MFAHAVLRIKQQETLTKLGMGFLSAFTLRAESEKMEHLVADVILLNSFACKYRKESISYVLTSRTDRQVSHHKS